LICAAPSPLYAPERCPRLLLCDDVRAEVDSAKSRLQQLAPECDVKLAVSEYPELIYRIGNYAEYNELPVSIQNIIMETSTRSEDEVFARDEWNSRWEDWDREKAGKSGTSGGLVSGVYGEKGLRAGDWMNAAETASAEWMLDGCWEGDGEEE
jgi:hypothetical protein